MEGHQAQLRRDGYTMFSGRYNEVRQAFDRTYRARQLLLDCG